MIGFGSSFPFVDESKGKRQDEDPSFAKLQNVWLPNIPESEEVKEDAQIGNSWITKSSIIEE